MPLDAGLDVNAESDAYGSRSTTLGLTATSCHPEEAGVQLPLMDLQLRYGAVIDGPRRHGGEWLSPQRARIGSRVFRQPRCRPRFGRGGGRGPAGRGRTFFNADGHLIPPATPKQMKAASAWACEFGRTNVVDFLLRQGIDVDTKLPHDQQAGLHWAAYGGHADTVKVLLERGAPVNAIDGSYGGTPLEWALYQWGKSPSQAERGSYYETVAILTRSGAKLHDHWFQETRSGSVQFANCGPTRECGRLFAARSRINEFGSGIACYCRAFAS